jgi:hypothetical protein
MRFFPVPLVCAVQIAAQIHQMCASQSSKTTCTIPLLRLTTEKKPATVNRIFRKIQARNLLISSRRHKD